VCGKGNSPKFISRMLHNPALIRAEDGPYHRPAT
jgi:hypothetical protein